MRWSRRQWMRVQVKSAPAMTSRANVTAAVAETHRLINRRGSAEMSANMESTSASRCADTSSATVAATRSTRVLNRLDKAEAQKLGVDEKTRRRTFRLDADKTNLAPPDEARWFQIVSVGLGNGGDGEQDLIGVVDRWTLPSPFDGVSVAHLRAAQARVATGSFRHDVQSTEWVGRAVAEVLNLDPDDKADRTKIIGLLKRWTNNGMFKIVERQDKTRKLKKFVEVGQLATD